MAINTFEITQLISEFRKLTQSESITPEMLGNILQQITNVLATCAANDDMTTETKSLLSQIKAEITARTNADAQLNSAINTEAKDRADQDKALLQKIASAEAWIQNDGQSLSYDVRDLQQANIAINKKITNETTARTNADKTLQTNIDALKSVATADADGLMSKEDKAFVDNTIPVEFKVALDEDGYPIELYSFDNLKRYKLEYSATPQQIEDAFRTGRPAILKGAEPIFFGDSYLIDKIHFDSMSNELSLDESGSSIWMKTLQDYDILIFVQGTFDEEIVLEVNYYKTRNEIKKETTAREKADTAINAEIATIKENAVGRKTKTWNGSAEVFNDINRNQATDDCSHAEGLQTTANGQAAHAEGKLTIAKSAYSHAEGDQTQAIGSSSHSEGFSTKANGYASHTEGSFTVANGNYTHAGGYQTKASNWAEQAIGNYNKSTFVDNKGQWKGDSESTLFSIGNGTSESDRKNAFEVKQDGTVLVQKPGTKEMVKVYDGLMTAEERDKFVDLVADIEGLEDVDETSSWLRYKRCDSSGDSATINTATAEKHGLMSKSDKATLDALPTQLAEEQTARTDADKVLTDNLAKEVADRTKAITALDGKIATETSNRTSADTALGKRIDAEQTAREQADTAINTDIQGIKDKGSLHDLFIGLGAEYDNLTNSYTYCDNTGLSLNDLIQAYYCTYNWWNVSNAKGFGSGPAKCIFRPKEHTNTYYNVYNFLQAFNGLGVKIIDLSATSKVDEAFKVIRVSSFDYTFQGSTKIEELRTVFDVSECKTIRMSGALAKCKLLLFKKIKTNVNVKDLPSLNKKSILFMIQNATPSSAITITLHPTAYAMATADPDIQAELEKQPNISLAEGTPSV